MGGCACARCRLLKRQGTGWSVWTEGPPEARRVVVETSERGAYTPLAACELAGAIIECAEMALRHPRRGLVRTGGGGPDD